MNRDNVRSPARSVANQEFHRSGEIMNEAAHRITRAPPDAGHRAINPSMSFPMEMDVIEPYLDDREGFMDLVLKPLQDKKETLYVLPNSPAKEHAERRYPHKQVKVVNSGFSGVDR